MDDSYPIKIANLYGGFDIWHIKPQKIPLRLSMVWDLILFLGSQQNKQS